MRSLSEFRKPPTAKAMGIEIECLCPSTEEINLPRGYYGFFYATGDASINEERNMAGVEFVSQPLSPTWLKREIAKLNKKIKWTQNDSCGIHIHVSRQWLTQPSANKIFNWLCTLTSVESRLLFGRVPNHYCRTKGTKLGIMRYCAINTKNSATIEFRMFASGDAKWAMYCVDMVEYMIKNANQLNIDAALAFMDSNQHRKECNV